MEIRELNADDLADDATLGEFFDVTTRAQVLGREDQPRWTRDEFFGAIRSADQGEREVLYAASEGSRLVGTLRLFFPLLDNTDKAAFTLAVDPPSRRGGIGRALVARAEDAVRADGRRLIMSDSKLPFDQRDTHPYRLFAEACGYQLSNVEVVRHLALPVPDDEVEDWIGEAAPHHDGYTIESYIDGVPDELVESLLVLLGQLAVDAPTGLVDFEEEGLTPARFAEMLERERAMGRSRFETVALTPARQVVAQSTLSVPRGSGTEAFQWGTFVHRQHRGHKLGLAVKAVNLRALQAYRDDLVLVTTQNAETNGYMISINERMGFRPVEAAAEFVKEL